jgi:hypothetical protein
MDSSAGARPARPVGGENDPGRQGHGVVAVSLWAIRRRCGNVGHVLAVGSPEVSPLSHMNRGVSLNQSRSRRLHANRVPVKNRVSPCRRLP